MKRPFLALAAVLLLAVPAVGLWRSAPRGPRPLKITFLDVGQGDAAVLQSPGGANIVVDAGRSFEDGNSGRQVVLPFLRSQGIRRLDALVLTHADDDHVGGAATLLRRIPISRTLVPAGETSKPEIAGVTKIAQNLRVPVNELAAGQWIDFGDGCIAEVLNPRTPVPRPGDKDNDRSIVLRVRHGATSLLLTGDIEESAESALSRLHGDISADVLKVPHHGSRTSSSERFLDRVKPQVAVISAGRRNIFNHPNPLVVQRLQSRGIRVFRTDQIGAVTVESDGENLRIMTTAPPPSDH